MLTDYDLAADALLRSLDVIPATGTRSDERRREALRLAAEMVRRDQSIEAALALLESPWAD